MKRKPSVLITGATGFLGGYAVREFLGHGCTVHAHGRNATALALLEKLGAHTISGELSLLSEVDLNVDIVIHAAALSSPWAPWRDFERSNVTGTRHVVRFMERNAVRRLVFVSSPSIYADRGDRLDMSEDQPVRRRPLTGYIRSKLEAESLLGAALSAGKVPELVILRPRGIVGAGDPSLAPRLLATHRRIGVPIFRGGSNFVDLTAVENVAVALRLAAETATANGQAYNISNGSPQTFRQLLDILFRELDVEPRYRRANAPLFYALGAALEGVCRVLPGHPEPPLSRYTVSTIAYSQSLDITKARTELGYEPKVSVEAALVAFANTYRSSDAVEIAHG